MRIQVLNPANAYKAMPREAVRDFIQGSAVKDGIVLQVTPNEGSDLRMFHDDRGALYFDNKAGLESMQVSTHSNLGLTFFSITEGKKAG